MLLSIQHVPVTAAVHSGLGTWSFYVYRSGRGIIYRNGRQFFITNCTISRAAYSLHV